MNIYDRGDKIRLKATFRNSAGNLADPTTIAIVIRNPDGSITTKTYVTNQDLVKESLGVFYFDYVCQKRGEATYRWLGDGVVTAAANGGFYIQGDI